MESLLTSLTQALEGSVPLAIAGAFLWGVASIVLSPCHLASIPLIVAFLGEQGVRTGRRALLVSSVFALGILVTIGIIGAITAALGRLAGDLGAAANYGVAGVFLLLGLHFLGVFPLPWTGSGVRGPSRRGTWAAFGLGLLFGVGVGPCTFAFMAPMLGITFKAAAHSWAYGASLLLLYGAGHCSIIVLAGTSVELAQRYLQWNERSRGSVLLRRVCGGLVILAGIYLIYVT